MQLLIGEAVFHIFCDAGSVCAHSGDLLLSQGVFQYEKQLVVEISYPVRKDGKVVVEAGKEAVKECPAGGRVVVGERGGEVCFGRLFQRRRGNSGGSLCAQNGTYRKEKAALQQKYS